MTLPIPLPIRTLIDLAVNETLGKQYNQTLYSFLQKRSNNFIKLLICFELITLPDKTFRPILPRSNLKCLNSFFLNFRNIKKL